MIDRIRRNPSLRWAWALIALGCVGLAVVIPLAVWTHLGQRADERSRWSAAIPEWLRLAYLDVLNTVSIPVILIGLLVAVVIALARRRTDLALAAAVVIGGANVTTQLGKALLPRRDFGIGAENTLPSGHMTVTTSLVLALLLVLPRLLRVPAVALGTFAATTGGAAIVILRWHRPSDVVAAVGVLAVWSGIAVLTARAWRLRGTDLSTVRVPAWNGPGSEVAETGSVSHTRQQASPGLEPPTGPGGGPARRDRVVPFLVASVLGAAAAGVTLIASGLAAFEKSSNVFVAGFTLTVLGLSVAVLVALVAAAVDGLDGMDACAATADTEPEQLRSR